VRVQVVTTDLARAAITDLVVAPKRKTWIARHRIGRVVVKRASASKTFNAAAVIAGVAVEIASVVEDSAVVAAADSEVGDEN
jgi:hypothetical protein